MLFNSTEFLFIFLPLTLCGYYFFSYNNFPSLTKLWLLTASLFFYSYWKIEYLWLLLGSISLNYFFACLIARPDVRRHYRLALLTTAVIANILFLGYFKYADFVIENINQLFSSNFSSLNLLLPLAISFFTFQQIAYLVDNYRGEVKQHNLLNYALFVCFFPQLIAGPIVHHKQLIPQIKSIHKNRLVGKNFAVGFFLLAIGLFKKLVIADELGDSVNFGYRHLDDSISFIGAWFLSLAFTLQLVFDFTAYSDMAIGIGLLFNIHLPINFYSSLKARSIGEFWERWHLTLTAFLRNYIYIPLGGNRKGFVRSNVNLFIVFMVAGIWHGAGWTFIMWGILQGTANILHRVWQRKGLRMNGFTGWFLTFNFINVICIYFRAPSIDASNTILRGMAGFNGLLPQNSLPLSANSYNLSRLFVELHADWKFLLWVIAALAIALFAPNAMELSRKMKINTSSALFTGLLLGFSLITLFNAPDKFIYFDF